MDEVKERLRPKVEMTYKMNRYQWLEHRRKGIGGSDVSAILGLDRKSVALGRRVDLGGRGSTYKQKILLSVIVGNKKLTV